MKDWTEILLAPETPILESLKHIDSGSLQIVFVVDAQRRLLGTVTDGDIRRGILRGIALSEPIQRVMNPSPVTAQRGENRLSLLETMKRLSIRVVPIVDSQRRVVGLETLDCLLDLGPRDNAVVIMAGGLGMRLRPLTQDRPKPMLMVGGRPILQIILENLVQSGFRRFFFAVNYKAEVIREHFGDGARWNASIRYLHESEPMGTAGALSLLPERPEQSLLVMNGDVLTKVDFGRFMEFHREHRALATMCVRKYDFQVPYGVVATNSHEFIDIEEKPVQGFFVNAGIYAVEPEALRFVPQGRSYNTTDWFRDMRREQARLAVFPVREYWIDVGQTNDLEAANQHLLREKE